MTVANAKPDELAGQPKEPAPEPKDELFSGSLEPSEGDEQAGEEPPQGGAEPKGESEAASKSAGQDEDSDPELKGIFDDLEKDIPEALKTHATNVKKKLQGYFTKKNQTISTELETLRKNQITDDIKRDYSTLYGWHQRLQQNPKEGLKALASELGISVKALIEASEAEKPKTEELTPDKLETAEDYANFTRQEVRKAIEELREKEVKPLKETLTESKKTTEQRENIQRGQSLIREAAETLPGFLTEKDGKKTLSKEAQQAIAAVYNGEFTGPNAVKNAFKAFVADSTVNKTKELENLLKEKETKHEEFKKNLSGAGDPPGGTKQTTFAPVSPDKLWDTLRSEPLT